MRYFYFFIIGFGFIFFIGTISNAIGGVHFLSKNLFPAEKGAFLSASVLSKHQKNPEISSKSAIVIEAKSNAVIFSKNAAEARSSASLVKALTAVVALENHRLSDGVVIKREFIDRDISKIKKFRAGETYTVEGLLHSLIIESNNTAAYALASLAGEDKFIEKMRHKAILLGFHNSFFGGPSGIDTEGSITNAYDMAQLGRYLMHKNDVLRIMQKGSYDLYDAHGVFKRRVFTSNELWGELDGLVGAKTGYTDQAQGNLLVIVKHPKKSDEFLISVVMGSEDRAGDTLKLLNLVKQFP